MWQHDYFVQSSAINFDDTREEGTWLGAWYTAASGGFDGRWAQLFDDRPTADVQDWFGHRNIFSTMWYATVTNKRRVANFERACGWPRSTTSLLGFLLLLQAERLDYRFDRTGARSS